MSATTTPAIVPENLDERMERIRKRNEELEKKHREAEEDRLMALKDNAMVKTKISTDDWPKSHRYDKLDFTYDEKEKSGESEADNNSDDKQQQQQLTNKKSDKSNFKRDYKKFADGEGPPPDPSYNFLADAERDGGSAGNNSKTPGGQQLQQQQQQQQNQQKQEQQQQFNDKNNWRQNNSNNGNGSNNNRNNKNGLNNSFRNNRNNGNGSGGGNSGNSNSSNSNNVGTNKTRSITGPNGSNNRFQSNKHDSGHDNSWKQHSSDRKITNEGKWRREWDNDKFNEDDTISKKMDQINLNNGHQKQHYQHPKQQEYSSNQQQPIQRSNHHQGEYRNFNINSGELPLGNVQKTIQNDTPMEKRGNIMVSVSQDGEVKSVKLQTNRAIGTGRVGPRQQSILPQNPYALQQQQQQNHQPLPQKQQQQQQQHHHHHHQQQQTDTIPIINHFQDPQHCQENTLQQSLFGEQQQQQTGQYYRGGEAVIPPRPFFDSRPNLQDRLLRHRQPAQQQQQQQHLNTANNSNSLDITNNQPDISAITVQY